VVRLGLVLLGGAIGSLLRHVAAGGSTDGVPWAVLWVNLLGALLAGVLVARVRHHAAGSRIVLPLAVVGLAGAFTTFGGLVVDTVVLLEVGDVQGAFAFATTSVLVGPLVAFIGMRAGARS
jgi:CrcB protein